MPMSKFSTLNYLFNSYQAGKKEVESLFLSDQFENNDWNLGIEEQEPSQSCIDAILSFASQCEVLKSDRTGNIELNLN
jgi:hypothetical protein